MYYFINGYTAKVAGTEMGITEPVSTFSACFGEAFIPLHPNTYAEMLAEKSEKHNTKVWLVNTGWSGGKYGTGSRMSLKITRAIIDAIHTGELEKAPTTEMDIFGLHIPTKCTGVDPKVLQP
jgi:phosphoenolpyruvate carboxykinase (ATP)